MKTLIRKNNKEFLLPTLFALLPVSTLFYYSDKGTFKTFGLLFLGLLFCFIYLVSFVRLLVIKKRGNVKVNFGRPLIFEGIMAFLYLLINFMGMLAYGITSRINIITFGLSLLFFILASYLNWNKRVIGFILFLVILYVLINIFFLLVSGHADTHFSGMFINPNSLGAYSGFLTFFPFLKIIDPNTRKIKKFFWLGVVITLLVMVYISDTRSMMFSLLIAFLVYKGFGKISRTRFSFNILFFTVLGLAISFITVYPNLSTYTWFNELDLYIQNATGKSLYSGREGVWVTMFKIVQENPWFGHGSDKVPAMYLGENLSAHNLFLQTALQSGWVGVTILCLILFSIWSRLRIGRYNKEVRLTGAFLIGFIIHQTFEVSLTQNNVIIGALQWLILAIGTSYALKHKQEDVNSVTPINLKSETNGKKKSIKVRKIVW